MYAHGLQSIRLNLIVMYKLLLVFLPDTVCTHFVCSATCQNGAIRCGPNATRSCIIENLLCNGRNDCGDNSDEEDCGELTTVMAVTIINHSRNLDLRQHRKCWKVHYLAILTNQNITIYPGSEYRAGTQDSDQSINLTTGSLTEGQPFHLICFKSLDIIYNYPEQREIRIQNPWQIDWRLRSQCSSIIFVG